MKSLSRTQGFTLLELMVVVSIVSVLASVALPTYQDYVKRAELVEAVLFVDSAKDEVVINHGVNGEFPLVVKGSRAWTAGRRMGIRVPLSQHRIRTPDSDMTDQYWYDFDPNSNMAWFAVRFRREFIPDCSGACAIHLGMIETRDGQVHQFCGVWARNWGGFPLELMPASCQETCVSCKLSALRR